ncbi:MAG: hypothetical protein AAF487_12445 [Bacteroidota bacterium]
MTRRTLSILFILLLVILIGSFREILFVNLNQQISFIQGDIPDNGLLDYMHFLEHLDLQTLILLKWVFTLLYCALFWIIGKYILNKILNWNEGSNWYTIVYVSIFILAGILFCLGHLEFEKENFFRLSRLFMGALQSPIPVLIFVPLLFLKKRLETD